MAAPTAPRSWLFGPVPDVLFGCGLAWMVLFFMQAIDVGNPTSVFPSALLIMIFALPHYGATLLRVYESPDSRRKYTVFSVYVSIALAVIFALTLRSAWLGSLVLTVYLTWSPWHYTGQNYGVFLMLMGRRGFSPTPLQKRIIYASFVLSYLLTFVSMHGAARATYAPLSYAGSIFRLMPIGLPEGLGTAIYWITGLGYAACLLFTFAIVLRQRSATALAPILILLLTQALWFVLPVFLREWRLVGPESPLLHLYTANGFLWIAAAHSIQYLWICSYYAVGRGGVAKIGRYLGKCYLGGYAIWILPGVVFAPALLGEVPAEAGLTIMIAAMVNLHHFVLDGVIWKLRDGRIASILLRDETTDEEASDTGSRFKFRIVLAVLGGIAFICVAVNHVEQEYGFRRALERGDLQRASVAATRLKWIGNDSARRRTQLGRRFAREGDYDRAMTEFRASLELRETPDAWRSIAQVQLGRERPVDAIKSYREALRVDSEHVPSLLGLGSLWIQQGRSDRALPLLERARALAPNNGEVTQPLLRARRDMGVVAP